jgi:flavin reductase ActVB
MSRGPQATTRAACGPSTVDAFRKSVAEFPSGVTIVTTVDAQTGRWTGYTASAFSSLSLEPPMVLVCLDRRAECFGAFGRSDRFAVNVLAHDQGELALRFARKSREKFVGTPFELSSWGNPVLPDAAAVLDCQLKVSLDGGDHVILIGCALRCEASEKSPLLYHRGALHTLDSTILAQTA